MKTTLFTYQCAAGTFWIRPEPAGRVRLGIDEHQLKTYSSPTAAARAVAERKTGWPAWDNSAEELAPRGLDRWKRAPGAGASTRRAKAIERARERDSDAA